MVDEVLPVRTKIRLLKDKNKEWYWVAQVGSRDICRSSESYKRRVDAVKSICRIFGIPYKSLEEINGLVVSQKFIVSAITEMVDGQEAFIIRISDAIEN